MIECVLVIIPLLYDHQTLSELILDLSSVGLFFIAMLIYCLRTYFDSKSENFKVSVKADQPSVALNDESINRSVDDLVKKTKEDLPERGFVKTVKTVKPINYNINVNEEPKNTENNFKNDSGKESKPAFFVFPKHSDASVRDEAENFEEKTPDFYLPSESNASSKVIKHFGNLPLQNDVVAFDNRSSHLIPPSRSQYNQHTPNILTPSSSSNQNFASRSKLNLNSFTVRSYRGD